MEQLSTSNSYDKVVSILESRNGSTVSVPELSRLLGVKPTTLNARFRRARISVCTVGRTNYVPSGIALNLAAHHKYALMGWPTLQQASQIIHVKAATLKARCEKGQLEGHLDLTKRLRINPFELEHVCLDRPKKKPTQNGALAHIINQRSVRAPTPLPEIKILKEVDYGLPEIRIANGTNGTGSKQPKNGQKRTGYLSYDAEKSFSVSECFVGKSVRYGQYDGTITKVLQDPFNPRIKVHFRGHPDPLMQEVLLAVGKAKT